jgi:hypothetical protein
MGMVLKVRKYTYYNYLLQRSHTWMMQVNELDRFASSSRSPSGLFHQHLALMLSHRALSLTLNGSLSHGRRPQHTRCMVSHAACSLMVAMMHLLLRLIQ